MRGKTRHKLFFKCASTGVACATFLACGGSGNEGGGQAVINQLSASPSIIRAAEGSILKAAFSFSANDVFDDAGEVDVLIHLPPGIQYRDGTAEIQRLIDDRQVNPRELVRCGDGSTFLHFVFDNDELADAFNPGDDADAELTLTVDALSSGQKIVSGEADSRALGFACGQALNAQAVVALDVRI